MGYGNGTKTTVALTSLSMAATVFLTGCGGNDKDYREVYCVDDQNKVVDEDECDDVHSSGGGGGGFFFLMGNFGGNRYYPGQAVPSNYVSQSQRIPYRDTAARTSAGLPASGKVASGSRIAGGIGKGSAGGTSKGGSSGG
jgi:hypothetical protein